MNRIDKIIKESINRFDLREVDEASLKNPAEAWANMEGGTYKQKRGKYNVQPRQRVKTLDDATTINQAGRLIRASWYSVELGAIGGFARNYALYGIKNADKFVEISVWYDNALGGDDIVGVIDKDNNYTEIFSIAE